jgi:hypothetical protein
MPYIQSLHDASICHGHITTEKAACRHMLSLDPEARLSPNEVRINVVISVEHLTCG